MRTYVVSQGTYVARIADRVGLKPEKIWKDSANKDLAELRGNPNILAPGDVLRLPEPKRRSLRFTAGDENGYTAVVQTVTVRVVFKHLGEVFRAEKFELLGLGATVNGVTDADGCAELAVPSQTDQVLVRFAARNVQFRLRIGYLDPAGERSGARQRLRLLGYLVPTPRAGSALPSLSRGGEEPLLVKAILAYQKDQGLPATGLLDRETVGRLAASCGA